MTTVATTVTVVRCDYCEKDEATVGFIQSYRMIPTRRYSGKPFAHKGARDLDLCAGCVELLTREHISKSPADTKPMRCLAKRDGVRCMLDKGHKSEHLAVDSAHWGWVVAA